MTTAPLKLMALDADDLALFSAALQDALTKVGEIRLDSRRRQLTITFNRFRWEAGADERVRSALQVGSVLKVQARKLRTNARDAVLELLTLQFEPGEAPGGMLTLVFAGGGDLRVEVECMDAVLVDISASWPAKRTPTHEI